MIHLHFIVNPISGSGNHKIDATFLARFFPEDHYQIAVHYTTHKKHAIALTNAIAAFNPDCIVACGGDGTINEVASCLVNSEIKLGIIPVGSGNGLASNLNIPKDIEKAVAAIKTGLVSKIDVGTVNNQYFFSNMGVGIDAMIISKYEAAGKRTLIAYVKAAIASSLEFKPQKTALNQNGKTTETKPFLLFISNSNEMGYKMSLTPKASLSDGFLDLLVVPELRFLEKLQLGLAVLRNKIDRFKKAEHSLIQELKIEMPDKIFLDIQIDGEHHNLKTNTITVGIIKSGLNVITP